jgi:uncharacterized protein (DUF1778 family)
MNDQTQYSALSRKAEKVIGQAQVDQMSDAQLGAFNAALDRLLEKRKSVEAVTPAEIEGQWEQIMHHVLPTGSHEHSTK